MQFLGNGAFESSNHLILHLDVDIESFWTEGYAGQIPNSGHELAIYVLFMTIVKFCCHNFTQSAYFMIFSVSSISYRPTDLSLSKEFSKNVSFSNM